MVEDISPPVEIIVMVVDADGAPVICEKIMSLVAPEARVEVT